MSEDLTSNPVDTSKSPEVKARRVKIPDWLKAPLGTVLAVTGVMLGSRFIESQDAAPPQAIAIESSPSTMQETGLPVDDTTKPEEKLRLLPADLEKLHTGDLVMVRSNVLDSTEIVAAVVRGFIQKSEADKQIVGIIADAKKRKGMSELTNDTDIYTDTYMADQVFQLLESSVSAVHINTDPQE